MQAKYQHIESAGNGTSAGSSEQHGSYVPPSPDDSLLSVQSGSTFGGAGDETDELQELVGARVGGRAATSSAGGLGAASGGMSAANVRKLMAVGCLLIMVTSWVSQSELLQNLTNKNSRHNYNKPFYINWIVKVGWSMTLIVWYFWPNRPQYSWAEVVRLSKAAAVMSVIISGCGVTYYASLGMTSVTGNTVTFNTGAAFVFVFSYFFLGEKVTRLKVLAVVISAGGVGVIAAFGSQSKEEGIDQSVWGYILVLISTILYAIFEVGWKGIEAGGISHPANSFFFIGMMGVANALLQWPLILINDAAGWEEYEAPHAYARNVIIGAVFIDTALNVFLLLGITLSSPLFMAVGTLLTVPLGIIADVMFHDYLIGAGGLVGTALVVTGFLILNYEEYKEHQESKHTRVANSTVSDGFGTV